MYSRINSRNTNALSGENSVVTDAPPSRTVSVLLTLSFAVNPVTSAVAARQSPNPSGRKSTDNQPPIAARRLSEESVTKLSRESKLCKNQMTTDATKMIVNARVMKSRAFSQMSCNTLLAEGRR